MQHYLTGCEMFHLPNCHQLGWQFESGGKGRAQKRLSEPHTRLACPSCPRWRPSSTGGRTDCFCSEDDEPGSSQAHATLADFGSAPPVCCHPPAHKPGAQLNSHQVPHSSLPQDSDETTKRCLGGRGCKDPTCKSLHPCEGTNCCHKRRDVWLTYDQFKRNTTKRFGGCPEQRAYSKSRSGSHDQACA